MRAQGGMRRLARLRSEGAQTPARFEKIFEERYLLHIIKNIRRARFEAVNLGTCVNRKSF